MTLAGGLCVSEQKQNGDSRTETPWNSIHGHGWSMAVPSLARPGPWMDQGWQSPLLSLASDGPSLARPGN